MKWLSILKNLTMPGIPRQERVDSLITLNDVRLESVQVINFALHHDVYKRLRSFKTPQYDKFYLMRGKKGFNTLLFQQNYDVIVTNKDGKVIDTLQSVEPGYLSGFYEDGYSIYFTTVGTINFYNIKNNDILRRNRVSFFQDNKISL